MQPKLQIRDSGSADTVAIVSLYENAFPDENLVPIVRDLLNSPQDVLSLVGTEDSALVGHVAFTFCTVDGGDKNAALLAPLAVEPECHRRGIGSALVHAGFARLRAAGVAEVLVLGDPAYYGRFGFEAATEIGAPYPIPPEWSDAWQSLKLAETAVSSSGTLRVPEPWRDPALWAP